MKSEFSEFSYGFAVVYDCIEKSKVGGLRVAPLFPSLIEEGKEGGYDVKLDFSDPIFLQFKLSKYLTRRNAQEIRNKEVDEVPYYRFTANNLHQLSLLKDLRKEEKNVFYTAPVFHTWAELSAYFPGEILENSIFVNVEFLKEDVENRIVYYDASTFLVINEDEKKQEKNCIPCYDDSKNTIEMSIQELVRHLSHEISDILERHIQKDEMYRHLYDGFHKKTNEKRSIEQRIKFLHHIFNVLFGVEPLIVYRKEATK